MKKLAGVEKLDKVQHQLNQKANVECFGLKQCERFMKEIEDVLTANVKKVDCIRGVEWNEFKCLGVVLTGFAKYDSKHDVVIELRKGFPLDLDCPVKIQVEIMLKRIEELRDIWVKASKWIKESK